MKLEVIVSHAKVDDDIDVLRCRDDRGRLVGFRVTISASGSKPKSRCNVSRERPTTR
jgi:hypothetical protein